MTDESGIEWEAHPHGGWMRQVVRGQDDIRGIVWIKQYDGVPDGHWHVTAEVEIDSRYSVCAHDAFSEREEACLKGMEMGVECLHLAGLVENARALERELTQKAALPESMPAGAA